MTDVMPFSNWLPVVPVFDLEINNTNDVITAGTFGRGLWRSETYTDCPTYWSLTGNGAAGFSYYQASDYITSSRVFDKGVGQDAVFKAANDITLSPGFNVTGGSTFEALIGPCGEGIPADDGGGRNLNGTYAGPMPELLE